MLRIIATGMALGLVLGGAAAAQTPAPSGQVILVGHDGEGPGRKLGHYKHKHKHKHRHGHRDDDRDWRPYDSQRWYFPESSRRYVPQPYYGPPPGYGSSAPRIEIYPFGY